jgi:cell division cycle 20-like protein 1 (cofactor of APC complex)
MLRQRLRGTESDRFITARSVERDKKIEKYQIKEDRVTLDNKKSSLSTEKKVRTPTIVTDEKQYSKKLYLSLLKSQIFDTSSTTCDAGQENKQLTSSKRKKKYQDYTSKISGEKATDPLMKSLTYSLNLSDIARKIDFSNFPLNSGENLCTNIRPVKENLSNLSHTKSSFNKFINFEIDDYESTKNFFRQKRIPKSPYKILDAPNLKDDFYLHLLDWSSKDFLAVGLDKNLYIWESKSSCVNLLQTFEDNHVTSVRWSNDGEKLFVGNSTGNLSIWDINKKEPIITYKNHSERIGIIACQNTNPFLFTTGSQDKSIVFYDSRVKPSETPLSLLNGHSQEVCGLKWSPNDSLLASGGNDNKLMLWNGNQLRLEKKFKSHTSAVKALDWSPHKFGCLVSGGGTQDRTLKIWNTNTMKLVESIETCSQVCNIAFSKSTKEFVTTHGYSDNLILLWDSETFEVKASLKGHKDRVIYLSTGPDFQKIVTGAGDETVRFWDVFLPETKSQDNNSPSNFIHNFNLR